ncbi:MAG: integration host factor subunit beta [Candidatus Omnitrophica bacterium]|nr:integration host factor subunit beta [Candidatus Omnitrophota bacterium]
MTKRDIVVKIKERTGIKQAIVKEVLQEVFNTIFEFLKDGKRVEIRNFGVFKVKKRGPKVGRNIKTGETIPLPEKNIVVFKPGLEMKEEIK